MEEAILIDTWMGMRLRKQNQNSSLKTKTKQKPELHGFSPKANYTNRATAACRRN
jgi:hypothetical protein